MRNQVPKMYESSAHWKTTSSRYGSFHSNGVTSTTNTSSSRRFGSPTSASHYASSSSAAGAGAAHANASPNARTTRFLPSVPPTAESSTSRSDRRATSLSLASNLRSRLAEQRKLSVNNNNNGYNVNGKRTGGNNIKISNESVKSKSSKNRAKSSSVRTSPRKKERDDDDGTDDSDNDLGGDRVRVSSSKKPSSTRSSASAAAQWWKSEAQEEDVVGVDDNDVRPQTSPRRRCSRKTESRTAEVGSRAMKGQTVNVDNDDDGGGGGGSSRPSSSSKYGQTSPRKDGQTTSRSGRTKVPEVALKSGEVTRKKIIKGGSSSTRPLAVGTSNQDNGTTRVRRTTTGSADVGGSPTAKTSILRGDHSITKPISSFNGSNARFSPSSSRGVNSSSGGIVADSNGVGASSGSPSTASLGRTRSFSDLTERFGDKLRLNENNGDGYERGTKAVGAGLSSLRRDSTSDFDSGLKNGVKTDANNSNSVYNDGVTSMKRSPVAAATTTTTRSSPQRSLGRASSKDHVVLDSASSTLSSTVTSSGVTGKFASSSTTTNNAASSSPSSSTSSSSSSSSTSSSSAAVANTSNSSSRHPHENSGLKGLRNLGNTCFMNSVIQCLSNTRQLLEYALNENYANDVNKSTSSMKGQLITAFAHLLQDLWKSTSSENYISPSAFKSAVAKFAPRFTGYAQQDAQEFLRYLLQGLAEDVNRVTSRPKPIIVNDEEEDKLPDLEKASLSWKRYLRYEDSRIGEIFVGQLKSTLKCTTCGYASVTFDPFWDLSLPLPKSPLGSSSGGGGNSIHACMSLFTKEEILDGDERPKCSRCKQRRRCTKSFSIQKFPRILVLHLKRFATGGSFRAKLSTLIDFPHALDLSDFAADSSSSGGGGKPVYNLYAVSNHSGSTHSGHYTAYCKHPYSSTWHYYNDSRVSKHSKSGVCSAEGYVLFYEHVG